MLRAPKLWSRNKQYWSMSSSSVEWMYLINFLLPPSDAEYQYNYPLLLFPKDARGLTARLLTAVRRDSWNNYTITSWCSRQEKALKLTLLYVAGHKRINQGGLDWILLYLPSWCCDPLLEFGDPPEITLRSVTQLPINIIICVSHSVHFNQQ